MDALRDQPHLRTRARHGIRIAPLRRERVAVTPLVRGRIEGRADEHLRCARAFAAAELRDLEIGLAVHVAKHVGHLLRRDLEQIREQPLEIIIRLAVHPVEESLFACTRFAECGADPRQRGLDAGHRNRRALAREASAAHAIAAEVQLVMRHQPVVHAPALRRRCRCRRSRAARSRCGIRRRARADRRRCSRGARQCYGSR